MPIILVGTKTDILESNTNNLNLSPKKNNNSKIENNNSKFENNNYVSEDEQRSRAERYNVTLTVSTISYVTFLSKVCHYTDCQTFNI